MGEILGEQAGWGWLSRRGRLSIFVADVVRLRCVMDINPYSSEIS